MKISTMCDGDKANPKAEFEIDLQRTAFFFDFDGTLAHIVKDPERATIEDAVLQAVENLYRASGGALAIISGRPVATLDRFFHPLKLPLAGVHGLERRDASGILHRSSYSEQSLSMLEDRVGEYAAQYDGLIAETKPGSVALHYRQRPDVADDCLAFAEALSKEIAGVTLMRGKMVLEFRLGGRSKADAVSEFMQEAPFRGRMPLFAGDDVTDEDAFRCVAELGGTGIKIGPGATAAGWRAQDAGAFHKWLCRIAKAGEHPVTGIHTGGHIQRTEPDAGPNGLNHQGRTAAAIRPHLRSIIT